MDSTSEREAISGYPRKCNNIKIAPRILAQQKYFIKLAKKLGTCTVYSVRNMGDTFIIVNQEGDMTCVDGNGLDMLSDLRGISDKTKTLTLEKGSSYWRIGNIYLSRIIMGISNAVEVHHKNAKWDNRTQSLQVISREKHSEFHSSNFNQNNINSVWYIENEENVEKLLEILEYDPEN